MENDCYPFHFEDDNKTVPITDPFTGEKVDGTKKKGDKRAFSPILWKKDLAELGGLLKKQGYHPAENEEGEDHKYMLNQHMFNHEFDASYFIVITSNCTLTVQAFIMEGTPNYLRQVSVNPDGAFAWVDYDRKSKLGRMACSQMVAERKWTRYVVQTKARSRGPTWVIRSNFPRPKWRQIIVGYMMPRIKKNRNQRLLEMTIDS